MRAFAKFQHLVDVGGPWFTDESVQEVVGALRTGLVLYQKLTSQDRKRTDGRICFKITPKFHSLLELSIYIEKTGRNPRHLDKCRYIFI